VKFLPKEEIEFTRKTTFENAGKEGIKASGTIVPTSLRYVNTTSYEALFRNQKDGYYLKLYYFFIRHSSNLL